MNWICDITHLGNSGIEHQYITAVTKNSLYTKLFKFLNLNWLEIHVYRSEEK